MPLINSNSLLAYCNLYRVLYLAGRYGGGKTSMAFRIAYDLITNGEYRYLISNVKSVWSDKFSDVTLREGRYADVVMILDEGGLFLKTSNDVEKFLAFLRKFNITILIPSVTPPNTKVRSLTVQRVLNLQSWGIPLWIYRGELNSGQIKEKFSAYWWKPQEIYGIYDTLGTPSDDAGISEYMNELTGEVSEKTGYKPKTATRFGTFAEKAESSGDSGNFGDVGAWAVDAVEQIRGAVVDLEEVQAEISDTVSSLQSQRRKRRGR